MSFMTRAARSLAFLAVVYLGEAFHPVFTPVQSQASKERPPAEVYMGSSLFHSQGGTRRGSLVLHWAKSGGGSTPRSPPAKACCSKAPPSTS